MFHTVCTTPVYLTNEGLCHREIALMFLLSGLDDFAIDLDGTLCPTHFINVIHQPT